MAKNTEAELLYKKLKAEEGKRKKLETLINKSNLELEKVKNDLKKFKKLAKHDISKRSELLEFSNNKIAKINSRLSSLVLNLQYGILLEDEDRKIVLINQKLCDLFGIPAPPDSLHGLDCGLMAEEFKSYFKNEVKFITDIDNLLEKKETRISDLLELKNGSVFLRDYIPVWVEGVYSGHLWVYTDVTEKIKTESVLNEQKMFYEEILNNIPSDIAVFGPDHEYLFVNPIGIKDTELRKWIIGKKDEDYCKLKGKSLSIAEGRRKFFNDVVDSKSQKEWEEVLTDNKGNSDYHLRRMHPIFDATDNLKMVIGYGINISVIKRAQKLTEEAAKNKERFLANMSHEIRTPMNGVLGLVNLLLKTPVSEDQKEKLKLLEDSAQNLLIIINDILDMEKIGSGNIGFENIQFSVSERLESVLRLISYGTGNKNIDLKFESGIGKDLYVIGDPTRFLQIVNNLLSNALKFTHKGVIKIKADIDSESEDKLTLKIAISDTGIGIPAHKIESIFKPFTQADANTSRLYGGTGLGLNISKSLVELQGGTIWVESELGKGSTFYFTIVFTKCDPTRIRIKEDSISIDANSLINLKVLLVEDNEINLLLAKSIMEFWGFIVSTANNGLEAIQELNKNDFDIILMDIQMPVMNGIDTSLYIRKMKSQKAANIPIIALTANAIKGDEKQYFEAGMNDVLTKPFKEEDLFKVISKHVKEKLRNIALLKSDIDNASGTISNYDLSSLASMSNNNNSFMKKMINLFIQTIPSAIEEMKEEYQNQNWENVSDVAHKIKPSISLFNITESVKYIAEIEHNARNKRELSKMKDLILNMESDILSVIKGLKQELEKI
ncbi:MAG: ATP-binding protein [Ignavibacteriae bacterium]|nr:ATP-binding protein [Ignavibacteriota bacterium]